jgi:hypothetical protein
MAITNGYTTGSAVKSALGIVDSGSDAELDLVIESVSRMIDDYTGRFFYNAGTVVSYYNADEYLTLPVDDIVSVSSLQADEDADGTYETTWAVTDYALTPYNAAQTGRPYTGIEATTYGARTFPVAVTKGVKLTAVRGWSAVPKPVETAAIIQSGRIFNRRNTPFGIAGAPEVGQLRLLARLDPDVEQMLRAYRVPAQAV